MVVAVADTNVLVSAIANPVGIPATVLAAARDEFFALALSEYILEELQSVLVRPYFTARVSSTERKAGIENLYSLATLVVPDPTVRGVSRDPKDDAVLGTAVAASAAYLVTGDADLLALGRYGDLAIVAPRAFLALLDHETAAEDEAAANGERA